MNSPITIEESPAKASPSTEKGSSTAATPPNRGVALAAVGVLVAVLLAGIGYLGYLGYNRFKPRGDVVLVDVPASRQPGMNGGGGGGGRRAGQLNGFGRNGGRNFTAEPVQTITQQGTLRYTAQAEDAILEITRTTVAAEWQFAFRYVRDEMGPAERDALLMRRRIVSDPSVATAAGVSQDQVKKLRNLAPATGMVVDAADVARVKAMWVRYIATTPNSPERAAVTTEILAALKQIGDASKTRTAASATERAGQVKAILTAEQIAKFNGMGR